MNLHEEITKLAYELYEKSGRASGMELAHWLEAEGIVTALHGNKTPAASAPELERRKGTRRRVPKGVNENASFNPGS
ncbi:MAG TPA: DUF2934 domain-containing protein [Nitrospiria bacterium]|nr:DUF2934 domain-containing protein [Nitrospiria bacterium]